MFTLLGTCFDSCSALVIDFQTLLTSHARIILVVCVCVCACTYVSVYQSVSTVFLHNCGSSELQTSICYEVGCLDGKLRLWSGEAQGNW